MKSTKTKTNSKTAKVEEKEKPKRTRETSNNKHLPGVEEIRAKAEEFYYKRMELGEFGTADGDWLAAEEFFRNAS